MKIFIDENYPKSVFELLMSLHNLSGNNMYKIYRWGENKTTEEDLNNSIFLVIDYKNKGISIPYIKLSEDGYRTFVCKAGNANDFTRFGLALTLFTVWPLILKISEVNKGKFLYSFKYGGKRLNFKYIKNKIGSKNI
jgi:hypothetical protein